MNRTLLLDRTLEKAIRGLSSGTRRPFYLYDRAGIQSVCRTLRAFPYQDTAIHFACMANVNQTFLRLVREAGIHVFVNSAVHLRTALAAGFRGEQILFAASAMDEQLMREVQHAGALVNLDSVGQIGLWRRIFPGAPFGIRCNIGTLIEPRNTRGGYFIGPESRLGLTPEEILPFEGMPDVAGLHMYVGTDICSLEYFIRCYEVLATLATRFPGLRYLDFGGGFGLRDEQGKDFDLVAYGRMAERVMQRVSRSFGRQVRMIIEPGRIIGGAAGYFVCRVIDVKQRCGTQYIGVNASSAQFPRPLLYPDSAHHPVTLLSGRRRQDGAAGTRSAICGCSTYSRDFLAREAFLPPACAGDIIVLGDAGSYCSSAVSTFLGFPPPPEIFYHRRGSRYVARNRRGRREGGVGKGGIKGG